jgi:glycosyltransferase involved in cell wall biosynthesis
MNLGLRPRPELPETYQEYSVYLARGVLYGIPLHLDPGYGLRTPTVLHHPAVLKADTLDELLNLIDHRDGTPPVQALMGRFEGYDLIRQGNRIHAVPQGVRHVDLDLPDQCQKTGVLVGTTVEEVRAQIRQMSATVPVEFTGWLPIVSYMGNCGQHPQFKHTATPPPGYRFTQSQPPAPRLARPSLLRLGWNRLMHSGARLLSRIRAVFGIFQKCPQRVSWRARLRLLLAIFRLFFVLRRSRAKVKHILAYMRSRNLPSQLLLAENRGLLFLASAPYTYNQNPWLIEIEDPTTLFYPFIENGMTCDLKIKAHPIFPIIKAQLEDERCKGIVTHVRSTARMLPRLFRSEVIARKVFYVPLGVKCPARYQKHAEPDPEHINLLFINSWCQVAGNIQVRGGLDVLAAFDILHERYPQLRLTLRTSLPDLDDKYHHILESRWVRVINRFLSAEEMDALHAESHIFLLPAARIHIVSLLQAMASGLAVVTSDGWGIQEYITHERNGLIVKGRYGVTSWADEKVGLLRENYTPCYTADPEMVERIVEAVSRLIEDPELRRRLGRTARNDVESTYNLTNWNQGLKQALDNALEQEPGSMIVDSHSRPVSCPVA